MGSNMKTFYDFWNKIFMKIMKWIGKFELSIFYVVLIRDLDLNRNSYGDSYAKKHC